jgi:DNA-binding transcriptional regulator YiaG
MSATLHTPESSRHNPECGYLHRLLRASGLQKKQFAHRIGKSETAILEWFSGRRPIPYTAQYCLEMLAHAQTQKTIGIRAGKHGINSHPANSDS